MFTENLPLVAPNLSFQQDDDAETLFRYFLLLADHFGAHTFECIFDPGRDNSTPILIFSCDGRYDRIDHKYPTHHYVYDKTDVDVTLSVTNERALYLRMDSLDTNSREGGEAPDRPGFKHTFPGTVVRVPLSTEDRGVEYDYSNLPKLSVGDIMDLFTNMEDSAAEYLLFLQNVVSIELRVSGEEQNVKAEILSTTREYRIDTAKALPKVRTSGRGGSADLCHFTEIVHSNRKNSSTKLRWCISQCLPNALQDYDKIGDSEPRVGIAALISIDDETFDHKKSPFCGRLFDRLSSSTTEQPVHIYGEFSSNSDLYQRPENSNARDCSSQLWNTAIPYALVAHAWSTFLLDISPQLIAPVGIQVTPESERYFSYWPRRAKEGKLSALVESIYHHTFSYILLENLPLWPTASGRKGIKDIFVCRMVDITILRAVEQRHLQGLYQLHAALLQLELPLAYLPEEIYDTIGSLWPDRKILTPVALSVFLTNHGGEVQHFSDATKGALLNYLMSRPLDEKFDHLIGIPLIPTCDGQWRALEYLSSLKFPANEREMSLFNKRPEINVDFRRLPSRVFRKLKVLQTNKLSELLQPWLVGDLPEYLRSAYFANITEDRLSIDASELESGFGHFVRELWQWIIEQAECSDVVGHLENLWLIPIADGSYQRVANAVDAAEDIVSLPLDATGSPLGDFMLSIKDKFNHPISILETSFQRDAAKLLKSYNRVWDSSNLSHVLSWLSYNSNAIPPLSSSLKEQLSQHLVELAHCHISGGSFPQGFRGSIRNLAIFKEACNTMDGIVINWVSLRRVCQYVVVCMDLAVPEIPNVVFLHCGCGATRELLKMFNLAESPDIPTLLSQYVIPALSSGMPTYIVERLGRYVLDNFSCLTRSDIDILRHIQFIPARTMDDTIRRLVLPSKCVDRHSETRSLYLERECVWVDDSVLMGYAVPLSVLGMVQSVTIELVLERVSYYIFSASKIQVKDIAARAEALILACVNMEIISSMRFREGKWLPAWSHDGELCLQSPPSCRDKSLREIAGFAMAIVPFDVGPNWSAAFGWTETPVQPKYIRAQIQALTVQKDVISLEKVLEYVANRNGYAEVLKDLAWIPSQSGVYFCPSDIFFDDFIRLEPRCSTIKSSLLKYEDFLRKTGVMERPSFEKLYEITAILGTGEFPLEGEDLEMAITICSIATSLYPESNYRGFKVPDWNGVLVDMALLVADAPHLCEGVVRFVHPSVPEDVKKTMRIPSLSDTCPPESVTEVRQTLSPTEPSAIQLNGPREKERLDSIKETLSKYRAEDALSILLSYVDTLEGASCVEWRLEDVTIIGTESEPVVCPKLFLITDGVIKDENLTTLIDAGNGNWHAVGHLDLGLLAMFFIAEFVQLISGDSFLLFDRNQAFTTVNENQKDVIKARLSTMRQRYPGQLLPFHGIQNFGPETEFLDAAVFMFTLGGHSLSQTNFAELDKITILLEDHMAEAEVALLFTRQISRIQYAIRFSHSRDIKVKWALARQTMYTEKVADSSFIDSVTITRILDTYTGACKTFWQIIKSVPREANGIQDTQSRKGSSLDSHKLAVRIRSHIDIQELPFQGVLLGKQLCVSRTEFPIHIHLPDNIVSQEFEMTPFKNLDQKAGVLRLYLELLAHLAAQFGEAAYAFWPQISPGTTFFNDFWRAIPRSELKLFVSVETTSSVEMRFPLTLSYSQAIFDTTPDHISASLRGLFTNLDIRNVVRPRDLITDALRQTVNISCVDPPFVRSLLKLPDAEFALLDIWAAENFSCQTISNILDFALKDVKGGDLQELDGCLCLPLANRTLGALRLTTEHINGANRADTKRYFVYNGRYYLLFEFIANATLHPGLSKGFVELLLNLGLNVKNLCSSDIPRILEQVEMEPQSKESHEFLETIWSFISNETGYDASAIHGFPVYLARKGANYSIISPESFEKEPAILAPSTTLEFDICGKIPGLYLVQESTFPKSRVRGEMLQSAGGLMRFTRALSQLAFKAHQTLESYVRYILSDLDLAVLRQLYIAVLGNIDANGTTKYRCILTMLRQLPLWENANGKLIPAMNGILLPHPRLFLPWLDICEKLLIPIADSTFEKTLAFLGLRLLDPTTFIRQFLVQNICQHKLCEEEVEQYASFLSVVLQLILVIPIEWPLACDGGLRYRKINELYDHRNPFFRASLRGGENEKFLHTKLRRFWDQNNGLRADATAHDYVNAAKQIQIRGLLDNNWKKQPDTQLQGDAQTVYQTLCLQWDTMKDEPALMERLLRICFIPTKRKFTMQPRFRMIRMQSLANRRPFNCFQELVLVGYVDICWSQCVIYETPPTDEMLSQIPGGGIPSIDIVIAHLRYLSSQGWNSATNLESYIKDVIATYKFLEEQVLDQKILEDGRLWCNQSLDAISTVSKDQFRLAWMDSKSLRTILVESTERRKFSASLLNGFPNLLKAIGLEQIASQLNDDTRNQVVQVAEIQELWEQERFCDVELNIRGETFKAHRIVLAAASGYWKRVFTGDNESRKLDIEQNCSKDTVLGVLRYMYTAKLPNDVAGTSGRFVEFLKLAREWEVVELRERLDEMLLRVKGKAAGAEKGDKRFNTVS